MILKNIRVYFISIFNNKLSSFINFFGLSLALAAAFMIYLYVLYESNYDNRAEKNVYRLSIEKQEQGKLTYASAKSYSGLTDILDEIPSINSMTRILYEECLFRMDDKKLPNQNVFWVDSSFIKIFNLNILKGARANLLGLPNEAMISRSAATTLFGNDWQNQDDIFQSTILLNEGLPFKIVGVFEDYPDNSHMKFNYLLSFNTLTNILGKGFGEVMPPGPNFVYSYVLLNESSDPTLAQQQINDLVKKHVPENKEIEYSFNLQQISTIHLDSHLADELNPNSSRVLLNVLKIVAVLIILIAMVNYINLSVSLGMKRVKEIGMKKVLGATKNQLTLQFFIDSLMSFLIVLSLSCLLVWVFINISYTYLEIHIPVSFYYSTEVIGIILFFIAIITLLPSLYMAVTMASIKPFSSGMSPGAVFSKAGIFTKSLILFQFIASTFLICSTILIFRQVNLMQNYSLGYNKENVVVLKSPRTMIGNAERENLFEVLKHTLSSSPKIVNVSAGSIIPGKEFLIKSENVRRFGAKPLGQSFSVGFVDGSFFETLGVKVVAGKAFDNKKESDAAIINIKALKTLGFSSAEEAIGAEIGVLFDGDKRRIVGVIEDYHHLSVHQLPFETIFLHGANYEFGYYPIRIEGTDVEQTIKEVEIAWNKIYTKDPFDFFFLDSFFEKQYKSELMFKKTFFTFSILAIIISCLGLFGLSLYSMQLRQREVCIRAILGASTSRNIFLLSKEYLVIVLLAFVIAVPLVFYFANSFLNNFAYRVDHQPGYYLLACVGMLITSFLTIGYSVFKVANKNPSTVLRSQ